MTFKDHNNFPGLSRALKHTHSHTTVLRTFFRDHPGEPVPEENFWTLRCKERLTEADTLTIRLGATPSGLTSAHLHHSPIFFYRPDALPAAQPTFDRKYSMTFKEFLGGVGIQAGEYLQTDLSIISLSTSSSKRVQLVADFNAIVQQLLSSLQHTQKHQLPLTTSSSQASTPTSLRSSQGNHSFSTMIFHDFSMTKKMNFHDLSAEHIFLK